MYAKLATKFALSIRIRNAMQIATPTGPREPLQFKRQQQEQKEEKVNIWRNKVVYLFIFYQDFIKGWESRVPALHCEVVAGQGGQWLVGGAWGAAPQPQMP